MQKRDVSLTIKIDFVKKLLEKWRDAGRLLKHLLLFISLNMQAIRKIVKKQNKRVRRVPQLQLARGTLVGCACMVDSFCMKQLACMRVLALDAQLHLQMFPQSHPTHQLAARTHASWCRLYVYAFMCAGPTHGSLAHLWGRRHRASSSGALQVGALDPGAAPGLRTTLLVAHPQEDTVHKQGSHLSKAAMDQLEEFQKHEDVLSMQTLIRERILQLHQARPVSRAVHAVWGFDCRCHCVGTQHKRPYLNLADVVEVRQLYASTCDAT